MPKKASGKKAWGFSDRSGRRYRLRDMRTEWTGVKVGPDEYEEKHPQLNPRSTGGDAEALHDPRPPVEKEDTKVEILGYDTVNLRYREPITARGEVGRLGLGGDVQRAEYVSIALVNNNFMVMEQGSIDTATNTFFPEGFEATMSLGVVSTESLEVNITGVSATGHPANNNLAVSLAIPGNVTLAGFGITASQGTITITPSVTHTPTGLSASVGQGTITVTAEINPSVSITGVQAFTFDNAINPYRDIDDDGDVTDFYSGAANGASVIAATGQTGTLQGNSAAGYEIEVQGRLFTDTSSGTDYFGTDGARYGRDDVLLKVTNKTGSSITFDSSSRMEVIWRFNKTADGLLDDERHVGVQFHFPMTPSANNLLNSNSYAIGSYLAGAHNLPAKTNQFRFFENRADTGAGYSTPVYQDTDTQWTAKSTGGSVNSYTWANNASVYFGTRFSQFPINVGGTDYGTGFINAGFVVERLTVMFAETTDNWTSTTAQADGFRIEFDDPANGGVGTVEAEGRDAITLTGVAGYATLNDPWDERTTNGQRGIGFDSLSGYNSSDFNNIRWGTSNTVDRYSWYVAVSTEQSYTITASDASQYTVVSDQSNTTYYNPEIHHHKGNLYSYDVSDSTMASHPLYISPWANAANSSYRGQGEDWNNDLVGSTVDWIESYTVVSSGGIGSNTYPFVVNDSGYITETNNSRIDANHYGSTGAKVECKAAHRDDTNDKIQIGLRTQFMSCRHHSAMNITIHMFPYCEWPERGSVPNDTTHWESQTPNLLETDYTYNDGLFGGAAQNNWQYRPDTWQRDDLEAFRGEGSQA